MSTINLAGGNTLLSTGAFPPVRAASTGSPLNPSTGGLLTVDGVALAVGDRVLCKDESPAVNNGIYSVQTGPWTRTSDAQSNTQFFQGMTVTCGPQGAVNAGQTFVCTCTDDPVVVGTSLLTFQSQSVVQTQQQQATSSTSLTIGAGSKTFTTQAGKAFQAGQYVIINETSNSANQMAGKVTAYSGTSLTVNVTSTGGSGTLSDWTIALANSPGAAGMQPPVGLGSVNSSGPFTTGHTAVFADSTGLLIKDGGAPVGSANSLTPAMFANAALGFALGMLNGKIVTSEAANALTVTIKTLAGATPSASDPVWFFITDGAGGWTPIELQAALSLTVPAGATLGTVNGQAGRQYLTVWNASGTPVLGIYNSLSGSSILCWDETSAANGTGISAGSTSAQVHYTASSLASKNFRVIGVLESTQATAGQWASTVTAKLFGPGSKKPGDIVQEQTAVISSSDSTASSTFVALTNNRISITPASAANLIRVESLGGTSGISQSSAGASCGAQIALSRGTTNNAGLIGQQTQLLFFANAGSGSPEIIVQTSLPLIAYDIPNTASAQTYAVQAKLLANTSGTLTYGGSTYMAAREIQI